MCARDDGLILLTVINASTHHAKEAWHPLETVGNDDYGGDVILCNGIINAKLDECKSHHSLSINLDTRNDSYCSSSLEGDIAIAENKDLVHFVKAYTSEPAGGWDCRPITLRCTLQNIYDSVLMLANENERSVDVTVFPWATVTMLVHTI